MKSKNLILYFVPFIVSGIILYLSLNEDLWLSFWRFLNIPAQLPPFSDLESISRALNGKIDGFNPYYENPYDLKQKPYSYTSIWLTLFDVFKLDNIFNFRIFNFIIIYFYVFIFLKLIYQFNNRYFTTVVFICFFSTSSFLVLERLNIELIIFILIYFISITQVNLIRIPVFLLAIILKLYPIFSVFIFLRNKRLFITMVISSLLVLFFLKDQIYLIMQNSIEYALIFVHGIPAIIKGIYYYSIKFDYFINEENYYFFKLFFILLFSIYGLILFLISFKFGEKKKNNSLTLEESLFLCGGGIYIGRMIFFSNFDYGLIFLIFTIPYILKFGSYKLNIFYILCLVISFNSIYLEGGDRYTFLYLFKSFFSHSIKIFIFSYICFYFGKIVNNNLKV